MSGKDRNSKRRQGEETAALGQQADTVSAHSSSRSLLHPPTLFSWLVMTFFELIVTLP